jgi:hypothetical protein
MTTVGPPGRLGWRQLGARITLTADPAEGLAGADFMHCLPAFHDTRTTVGQEGPSTPASPVG